VSDIQIEIIDVKMETGTRRARLLIVFAVAKLMRVPIRICDEFWSGGESSTVGTGSGST
jgi:hypothetical protein